MKGRIVHALVSFPFKIFDIGCGTGVITRYLATKFTSATAVCGIDLCPVPFESMDTSQKNLSFIQGNSHNLTGKDSHLLYGSMDLVYSRLLLCGMTDWPGYVRETCGMLRPSGWAEFGDFVENFWYTDGRSKPVNDWEWLRAIRAGGLRKGLDLDCGLNIREYMEDAGFVDIRRWEYRVPI